MVSTRVPARFLRTSNSARNLGVTRHRPSMTKVTSVRLKRRPALVICRTVPSREISLTDYISNPSRGMSTSRKLQMALQLH